MSSSAPLSTVGVLDDHPIVLAGLTQIFQARNPAIKVVRADLRSAADSTIDVLLCDAFGGAVGIGPGLDDLVARAGAKVVLFAGDVAPPVVDLALRSGIAAYLPKRSSPGDVVAAVEAVHRGEGVRAPAIDRRMTAHVGERPGTPSALSPRELEIIVFIASGRSNEEIAQELFLGLNTVKTYIRGAYRKIGVQRRTHAVLWAIENGVVTSGTVRFQPGAIESPDRGSDSTVPSRTTRPHPKIGLTAV